MSVKKIEIEEIMAKSGVNERLVNKEFGKKLREFRKSMGMSKKVFGKSFLPKDASHSYAIELIEKGCPINNLCFFILQGVYVEFGDSIHLIDRYRAIAADFLLKEIDVSGDIYIQYHNNVATVLNDLDHSLKNGFSDCLNGDRLDRGIIYLNKKETFLEKDLKCKWNELLSEKNKNEREDFCEAGIRITSVDDSFDEEELKA